MEKKRSRNPLARAAATCGLVVVALAFGLLAGSTQAATPPYEALDVGVVAGTTGVYAVSISGTGQVVGTNILPSGARHAFSWTETRGLVDLGTLGGAESWARDVNDSGLVVGASTTASGKIQAAVWTPTGDVLDLNTLDGAISATRGAAEAVNNQGQVVGTLGTHAFSWTQAGGIVDLGTLGG